MKTIKNLTQSPPLNPQFLDKIKLLPNLESIHLPISPSQIHGPQQKREELSLILALRTLKRLKKLRSLKIGPLSKHYITFLQQLNHQFPRLFTSLTNLNLSCGWQGGTDTKLLIILKQQKGLIKYITGLNLPTLCSPVHQLSFQHLKDSLPNLLSLSFGFSHQDIMYFAHPRKAPQFSHFFTIDINFLQTVRTFHNLTSLHIKIADTWTFLKDFVSPPSLRHLTLFFEEYLSKEIIYRIDSKFIDKGGDNDSEILKVFQKDPFFLKFYGAFFNLHCLETLVLNFSNDSGPQAYKYQCFLTQCILNKTPSSLKKFVSLYNGSRIGLNQPYWFSIQDTNLPHLLEVCHRFSHTLLTLEIGNEKAIYEKLDLSSSHNKLAQLTTVNFTGKFDDSSQGLISNMMSFIEQLLSLGESLTLIKLNTYINGTVGPLVSLLRQLNKLKRPEKVKLELQLQFLDYKDLKEIPKDLQEKMSELEGDQQDLGKLKRVSLILFTLGRHERIKGFLKVYAQKFDRLQISSKSSGFL